MSQRLRCGGGARHPTHSGRRIRSAPLPRGSPRATDGRAHARHYVRLLALSVAAPAAANADLPLVSGDERTELLERLNATTAAYPATLRVHERFAQHARATPDAVALIHDRVELSYGALNRQANQLARHLRELGVGPDVVVGICLERTPSMVVSVLAVLKAGGAYLPLDPTFPRERLAFMLEDGAAKVVLTQTTLRNLLPPAGAKLVCVDADAERQVLAACDPHDLSPLGTPEHLAYVIYTSGSTGKPKGVMIPQRAVENFLGAMQHAPGFSARDRLLAATTLAFDPAVFELLLPLVSGGVVVLAGSEERIDPLRLCEMIDEFAITTMCAATTTWTQMVGTGWQGRAGLRAVVGGEALSPALARDLLARCAELWNQYGPTETTVAATCWRVSQPERGIFIGTPLANVRCLVLDARQQLAARGAYGELYIGGLGLARGYLNREELTASRFVDDPHVPGERLYRTGDLVRWHASASSSLPGASIIKSSCAGFGSSSARSKPSSTPCAGVRGSVAVIREDSPGDPRLVAYVAGSALDARALRKRLAQKLPSYMLPNAIVALDALPRMSSGKVDRNALPAPSTAAHAAAPGGHPVAIDALQRGLVAEWEEVLHQHPIGLDDDFFELGGHSLLAISLLARIASRFGHRLTPAAFLAAPTVRSQAELLRSGLSARGARSLVPSVPPGPGHRCTLRRVGADRSCRCARWPMPWDPSSRSTCSTTWRARWAAVKRRASRALRPRSSPSCAARPAGPYQLAGFSLGAGIVYEMARQLHAAGSRFRCSSCSTATRPAIRTFRRSPCARYSTCITRCSWSRRRGGPTCSSTRCGCGDSSPRASRSST